MSEKIIDTSDLEREEEIVKFEDGGSSAIVVSEQGAIVDLYDGMHKYLRSPQYDPSQRILITGSHPESGDKVKLVIDGNYAVAFGIDKDGTQFAEVSNTTEGDYESLAQPLTIGQPSDAFNGLVISSVGAEYEADGGRATKVSKQQNPFSIAKRLIARAKTRAS